MNAPKSSLLALLGAGPGLGTALATRFAAGGYRLALLSRHADGRAPLLASLKAAAGEAHGYDCEAGDAVSVGRAFAGIRQHQGDPDLLIYNVGAFLQGGVLALDPGEFEAAWRSNCLGAFLAARQVLPAMQQRGQGGILVTGATAAVRGGNGFAGLAVGKFGLRALAQSLAREFGPQGIHVAHVIIDGQIDTPATRARALGRKVDSYLDPAAIAETYWQLAHQPRSAWTQEVDLRPADERF